MTIYEGNGSGRATPVGEPGDMMSGPMPLAAYNRAIEARRGDEEYTSQKFAVRSIPANPRC